MTTHEPEETPRDELDELAGALHAVLRADAAAESVDWERVQRIREARARRRRVAFLAGGISALAATLAAILVLPRLTTLGGGSVAEERGSPSQATAPSTIGPATAERRVLRDDGDVRIVAEGSAAVGNEGPGELRLDGGRIWLRVHRSTDGALRSGAPLCVRTPALRACVHGTAFEVAALAGGTVVTVVEGVVRVERPDGAVVLVAGGHRLAPPYAALDEASPAAVVTIAEALGLDAASLAPPPEATTVGEPRPATPTAPGAPPASAGALAFAEPRATEAPPPVHARPRAEAPRGDGDAGGAQPSAPAADAGATPAADDLEALYRAAERALGEGRPAEALGLLERIAATAPRTIVGGQALMDIGQTHLRAGRPAEARAAFQRYLAEQPTGALRELARMSVCRIDAGAGRFSDAAACYSSYLEEFPGGAFADEARRATGGGTVREEARTPP